VVYFIPAENFDELGRDFRISRESKLVMVVGFPPVILSSWMKVLAMAVNMDMIRPFFRGFDRIHE
jgi:hypothetical protein